jgi:hypothetical protein
MNRNQKIAIGCGAAGCLGLLVVIAAGAILYFYLRQPTVRNANRNSNFNISRDTNRGTNGNTSTDSSDETSSSSAISDDDKHRLFHAAGAANDIALFEKVMRRLGLFKADGSPSAGYGDFVRDHVGWLLKNSDFTRTVDTPEKARAYVNAHIDD